MARKRHAAEEIVTKLRQVDVLTSQGKSVAEAVRSIGVTGVTYYRWRSEYGGLKGQPILLFECLRIAKDESSRALAMQGVPSKPTYRGSNPFDISLLPDQRLFDVAPGAG